jgi:hypothetical protein
MALLGDEAQAEAHFSPFVDNVSVGARWMHSLRQQTIGSKLFWTHLMVLLGDEAQVKAHFGTIGDSANLNAR